MSRPTAIDLFSGAGGLSIGLHAAGFDVLLANDRDAAAARSYRRNLPRTAFIERDVRQLSGRRILAKTQLAVRELDLLIGGPPCQGFSIIGARVVHDERNDLFRDFLRIGEALKPKCMVIENVPGLATLAKGAILKEILGGFRRLGYTVAFAELLAAQYGVPQMRWRMVFVGFRKDLGIEPGLGFPKPTHGRRGIGELIPNCTIPIQDMAGFVTTREAIGDLPPVQPGEIGSSYDGCWPQCSYQRESRAGLISELYNHYAPKLSSQNMCRIAALKEGQDWRDLPRDLLPAGMRRARRKDHTRRYSRMTWSGVPRSIITRFRDPKSGEYTHPSQNRTISIREAARIQSFPDRFAFEGSYSEQYEQVGNAVPPKLAAAVALEVRRCLEGTATHRLTNAFARRPSINQTSLAFDTL
jgi:DNA (cytosine-5)-methyltransferase 1